MDVVEFRGYYESFHYYAHAQTCTCNAPDPDDFPADRDEVGAYTN